MTKYAFICTDHNVPYLSEPGTKTEIQARIKLLDASRTCPQKHRMLCQRDAEYLYRLLAGVADSTRRHA